MAPAELAATGRLIVLAAFAAGLAIGLRTQTAWLTLPLLVLVIADRAGRSAAAAIVGSAVTFTAGVLCWALPLVIASGGPAAYWQAIASQAGEDLEGVDMLFTSTRPVLAAGDEPAADVRAAVGTAAAGRRRAHAGGDRHRRAAAP